ncbi:MAG: hypothetical protein WAU21_11360 [Chitinophagales bacterium]|nr:hypothetical protein [Bacteroidota bacterium]MBK8683406.1 hypothetical protein [Bacteroidota bacterium]
MKKHCIYLILFSLIFITCDIAKPPIGNTQIFSGYLYEDCNMEPKINHEVNLFQDYEIGLIDDTGGSLATGYTDSTGYFRLEFNHDGIGAIHFREGTNNLMDFIPWNLEIAEVNVFRHPTYSIQLSLNVINSYIMGDTLTISDISAAGGSPDGLRVPCPLTSGILYTYTNVPLIGMIYEGYNWEMIWWINEYNSVYDKQEFTINKYCNDTIFVTATIE